MCRTNMGGVKCKVPSIRNRLTLYLLDGYVHDTPLHVRKRTLTHDMQLHGTSATSYDIPACLHDTQHHMRNRKLNT